MGGNTLKPGGSRCLLCCSQQPPLMVVLGHKRCSCHALPLLGQGVELLLERRVFIQRAAQILRRSARSTRRQSARYATFSSSSAASHNFLRSGLSFSSLFSSHALSATQIPLLTAPSKPNDDGHQ